VTEMWCFEHWSIIVLDFVFRISPAPLNAFFYLPGVLLPALVRLLLHSKVIAVGLTRRHQRIESFVIQAWAREFRFIRVRIIQAVSHQGSQCHTTETTCRY
jgi:hypothetical protein